MFTDPHNQNLIDAVARVLSGETTEQPIKSVPVWLSEAAKAAADCFVEAQNSGEVMTLEIRRDILRNYLSEAISGCNCEIDNNTPIQFEKEVRRVIDEDVAKSMTINEAPKASPQEDEWLTDLTKEQIAAISPLMKRKNWDKLKEYLMSQKLVDKNFEDIQGYKLDRDVLSILQRSFSVYHEQVENVEEGALNTLQTKLPTGVNLGKIIGGTQEWRRVDKNTNIKKSVAALTAEIKKIAHMVGNPDEKTTDLIAKALIADGMIKKESVEHIEEATDAHNRMMATYASSSDKKVFDALKRDGYIVNFENSDTLVRNILKKTGGDVNKAVEAIKKMKLMKKMTESVEVITEVHLVPRARNFICNTNGKGIWSEDKRAVKVTKVEYTFGDDGNNNHSFVRAYYNKSSWDTSWNNLIYSDPQWLREFKSAMEKFVGAGASVGLSYSEQGMQGADYVHLNLRGKNTIAVWEKRGGWFESVEEEQDSINEAVRMVAVPRAINFVCNTNGKGIWSEDKRAVKVTKVVFQIDEDNETIYVNAYFDKSWSVMKDGLIYSDPQWLREFKSAMEKFVGAGASRKLNYTEQGMQTAYYVSLEIDTGGGNKAALAAWSKLAPKSKKESVEQIDELNKSLLERSIPMPQMSADELYAAHYHALTTEQKNFLKSFISRWEKVERIGGKKLDYQYLDKEYKTWLSKNTLAGKAIKEGTKESYGKLSFESFERGNISGWHIRARSGEIGWIELRKDIRNNEQQHFLWLETGNMEENIKVLNLWVKGTGKDFVGTKTQNQGSKGKSDNISFELGKLLPAVTAWITKNHPNLIEQTEQVNEEVEVEVELREFLTHLNTEEVDILRNIINETN